MGAALSIIGVSQGPLPRAEYEAIYAKVPRLTVEVIVSSDHGVLLTRREGGPCKGLWHIPGGTVRFGESVRDAVERVAHSELGIAVVIDNLLGYIEYPSHLERGLDWPIGIAFAVHAVPSAHEPRPASGAGRWFSQLPEEMHEEQKDFLLGHGLGE